MNRADKKVERYKEIGNEKANDIVDLYAVIGNGRMIEGRCAVYRPV